jgi:hypothetical protein
MEISNITILIMLVDTLGSEVSSSRERGTSPSKKKLGFAAK